MLSIEEYKRLFVIDIVCYQRGLVKRRRAISARLILDVPDNDVENFFAENDRLAMLLEILVRDVVTAVDGVG